MLCDITNVALHEGHHLYISYILGFTFYGVIIVNQLYCGCCNVLSMFMDEKHHQLVTNPVCEVPKTDV